MNKLEQFTPNAALRGILSDVLVTVVNVQWFGNRRRDSLESLVMERA
jgi:hypothetical protein